MPIAPAVHGRRARQRIVEPDRQRTRSLHTGTKEWRLIRQAILIRDSYTCQACERYGNEVDHKDGNDANHDPGNLQTLCKRCHSAKTAGELGYAPMLPTFRHKPIIPVSCVCGPPGSGKTTYARRHAGPHDLILDLDEIKARMSGCDVHDTPDDALWPAVAERNSILASLSRPSPWRKCWFVLMAPGLGERRHWRDQLGAKIVVLEVGREECLRRIAADGTRAVKPCSFWDRIVTKWWRRYVRESAGAGETWLS